MKIISTTVNWYRDYANSPRFNVVVDHFPSLDELVFTEYKDIYWAEKDGYVHYFAYSKPGNGFGGWSPVINMIDGSQKTLIGPWSSRASCANKLGFYPCTEVVFSSSTSYIYAANLTIDRLFECAEMAKVYLVLELCDRRDYEVGVKLTVDNWKDIVQPLGQEEFRFNPSMDPYRLVKG